MIFMDKIEIIKKMKDKLIYIISFIYSIYISYLICRLYIFDIKGILCISIVNIIISLFLTYLCKKKINYDKVRQKNKIIIILTVSISILVLLLNWNIFTHEFNKTNITIYSENLNIEKSNILKEISLNNFLYTVENNQLYNEFQYKEAINTDVKIYYIDQHTLKIDFDKYIDIKILLNKQNEDINILDGDNISTIKFEDDTYVYNVTSNSFKDNNFIIRTILSFITIIYITSLLISIFFSLNKEKKFELITMLVCAISDCIYFKIFRMGKFYPDSFSYINYDFIYLLFGKLNGRTPVYPFIIRVCQKIFNKEYLYFVCVVQHIIWFIAIICLYKTLKMLIKNDKIVAFITILYALCPAIIDWNNIILTESIALSGTVILIYFIIKYIKKPKWSTGNFTIILAFILTFHRPTSIIYVVFLEIFWIARFILDRKNIKIDFKCFLLSTVTIILIIIYAIIFKQTYGIYSITDAIPRQDLFVCIQQGYYKKSNNEQFIENIENVTKDKKLSAWAVMRKVTSQYSSLGELKKLTNYCKWQCFPQYVDYLIDIHNENLSELYNHYSFKIIDTNLEWLENTFVKLFTFLTFSHVYIIILIELVLTIYNWIKTKKVPWIHLGLFAFPLVIIESSFIGTCAEFMRTSIYVLPFAYIALATYIDMLIQNKNVEKFKRRRY